ncbi:hypothetical protein DERP_012790 [Dermatophagoides pteronyssinus]|uniref:Uncharacterized protein n=1 Tax=Dermatophagoides pteronyssinus TaxID=6956 RepID=A0ABQ8JFM0_DERPT|nr:hypothetical protein DERP_012790 [Dermatophagoides pteronyssinus]
MYKPHHIQARNNVCEPFRLIANLLIIEIYIEREYMLLNSSINDVTNRHPHHHSDSFPNDI